MKISQELLRQDVDFLSDSLCAGRALGTPGGVEAAAYLMRRLASMGYKPEVRSFQVDSSRTGHNIIASTVSSSKPAILIMAYYDGLGILNGRMYPGADSNASGVAGLLALAGRLSDKQNVVFAFLDGHYTGCSGAAALQETLSGRKLSMVVNLDTVGSVLSPVYNYWPDFVIALGGEGYKVTFDRYNEGIGLHLHFNYYGSRNFTEMFYRRTGDQKGFVAEGVPTILFTSGITEHTNKPADTPETLHYDVLSRRIEFVARFLAARQ